MKGFTPYKRRANEFKYIPRFYDPEKEARDARRAELRGSRPEGADEVDYVPGEYLRRQREARDARRAGGGSKRQSSSFMILGIVIIILLGYMLLPRIITLFMSAGSTIERVQPIDEYQDFDPYAPIRIVPNDYQGDL